MDRPPGERSWNDVHPHARGAGRGRSHAGRAGPRLDRDHALARGRGPSGDPGRGLRDRGQPPVRRPRLLLRRRPVHRPGVPALPGPRSRRPSRRPDRAPRRDLSTAGGDRLLRPARPRHRTRRARRHASSSASASRPSSPAPTPPASPASPPATRGSPGCTRPTAHRPPGLPDSNAGACVASSGARAQHLTRGTDVHINPSHRGRDRHSGAAARPRAQGVRRRRGDRRLQPVPAPR